MFDPLFSADLLQIGLLGVAALGFIVGMYWIYRITKDIEDS